MSVSYSRPTLPPIRFLKGHTQADTHTGGSLDSLLWPVIHELHDAPADTCPVAYAWLEWCEPTVPDDGLRRTLFPRVSLHHPDGSFEKWDGPSHFATKVLKDAGKKWKSSLKVVPTSTGADGQVVYQLPRKGASRKELQDYVGKLPRVVEQAERLGFDVGTFKAGPEGEKTTKEKEAKKRKSESSVVDGEKRIKLRVRQRYGEGRKESEASTDDEWNRSEDNPAGSRKFGASKGKKAELSSESRIVQKEGGEGELGSLVEVFLGKLKEAGELAAQLLEREAGLREKCEEEMRKNEILLERVREERMQREVLAREVREEKERSEGLRLENEQLKEKVRLANGVP